MVNSVFYFFFRLLLLSEVFGIIERSDDRFRAKFTIIKPGRVSTVLMYRDDVAMRECLYACVSHLQCVSVNYHGDLKRCELSGSHFGDELHGRDLIGWKHFDTPQKGNLLSQSSTKDKKVLKKYIALKVGIGFGSNKIKDFFNYEFLTRHFYITAEKLLVV